MVNHVRSQKSRCLAITVAVMVSGGAAVLNGTGAGADPRPLPPVHVVAGPDAAAATATVDPGLPPDDPAKGLVRAGLVQGLPGGPCVGLLKATLRDGSTDCTHGPDPAPRGIDVRQPRTVQDIALTTSSTSAASSSTSATVPCYGDGTTGDRIQAIYAHASDTPDRYASLASLFPQWAANADAVFNNSAAKTGGIRHLRFVTDAGCNLSVARVTLSPTGDDNMSNTELELQSLGFDRSDRKYIVWTDANVYCGIGDIRFDDQPGATNMNNDGRSWARVDSGCWGYADSPEAHEIMHMMGGVQPSAPHASAAWHCTDESDRMCYADGPNVVLTYPCPAASEMLFDCGDDDYFNTSPSPTSYLGTHWDSANNVFLETTGPAGGTTTTTTPPPSATTSTWSGSLKGSSLSKAYSVTSGSGTMVVSATYSGGGSSVSVTVKTPGGAVVGQNTGPSGVSLSVPVSAGTYSVTIAGAKNTSYTLSDTRPT